MIVTQAKIISWVVGLNDEPNYNRFLIELQRMESQVQDVRVQTTDLDGFAHITMTILYQIDVSNDRGESR